MQIVVTGANRGIGLEFVKQLSQQGHHVVATARQPDKAQELQQWAQDHDVMISQLDVSDAKSVEQFVGQFADKDIDVLINNAGVYPKSGQLGELDWEMFSKGFEVNAIAPIRLSEALLPALKRGQGRKIAQVTSQMGSIADNGSGGHYAYRMSKAALNMGNKSLAQDLGEEGFVCLALHPGWVQTDMGGANAKLTPKQSVEGMIQNIFQSEQDKNGAFLSWDGSTLPW